MRWGEKGTWWKSRVYSMCLSCNWVPPVVSVYSDWGDPDRKIVASLFLTHFTICSSVSPFVPLTSPVMACFCSMSRFPSSSCHLNAQLSTLSPLSSALLVCLRYKLFLYLNSPSLLNTRSNCSQSLGDSKAVTDSPMPLTYKAYFLKSKPRYLCSFPDL